MKKRIRLQGQLIFFGVIGVIVLSQVIFQKWHTEGWEDLLDICGFGLVLLGFIFRISARGYKSEHSDSGRTLVKDGPYTLTRNPMYLGTFLIGAGVVTLLFHFTLFLIFMAICLMIYIPQIKKEEALLLNHFGQEYSHYCQTVPRTFPKLSSWLNLPKYFRIKISWIKKEFLSLALIIVSIVAVEIWIDTKMFGYQELLSETLELILILILFMSMFGWLFLEEFKKTDNFISLLENILGSDRGKNLFPIAIFFAIVCLIGLIFWVKLFPTSTIDTQISQSLQQETHSFLWVSFMTWISLPGDSSISTISVGLLFLLFLLSKNKREAFYVLLVFIADLLTNLFKIIVDRPRPTNDLVDILSISTFPSFPSGHVVHYVVFFGFLLISMLYVKNFPRALRLFIIYGSLLLILSIGTSRVYLGAHFTTDVIGGYLMGLIFLSAIVYCYTRGINPPKVSLKS
ncbi:MAG: phosphatase PAP2 family protein [Candidatus Omnitrophota bacterium]|nr:phosphatase PAP2 family protein [Candidatus Omnitrophota bacterium]